MGWHCFMCKPPCCNNLNAVPTPLGTVATFDFMSNSSKIRSPHSDGQPDRLNQSDASRRQPVQIAGGGDSPLYVLANDGTIWRHNRGASGGLHPWVPLPELPQDDDLLRRMKNG